MKKIKFRGKNIKTGKFVYGGIIQDEKQSIIVNIYLDDEGYPCPDYVEVAPDSVAQFIGYDADGNEIYDKDAVIDIEDGDELWGGTPRIGIVDEDGNFLGDIGDTFEDVRLKEN